MGFFFLHFLCNIKNTLRFQVQSGSCGKSSALVYITINRPKTAQQLLKMESKLPADSKGTPISVEICTCRTFKWRLHALSNLLNYVPASRWPDQDANCLQAYLPSQILDSGGLGGRIQQLVSWQRLESGSHRPLGTRSIAGSGGQRRREPRDAGGEWHRAGRAPCQLWPPLRGPSRSRRGALRAGPETGAGSHPRAPPAEDWPFSGTFRALAPLQISLEFIGSFQWDNKPG